VSSSTSPSAPIPEPAALTFRTRHRLTHALEFAAVYDARMRKSRAGVMIFTRPNAKPHHRLGLAVGTRVGNAVHRGRTKRLIREAFRLAQHDLARHIDGSGFDIVVSVRTSRPFTHAACSGLLGELLAESANEWRRRAQ